MSKVFAVVRGIWHAKLHVQKCLLVLIGLALTVLICAQVVSRYVFNTAIFGIEETACYLAIWLYFLGAAVGAEQREHMSASLVDLILPSKSAQKINSIIVTTIGGVLSAWMAVWAWDLTAWSMELGMTSTEINIPVYYAQLSMPVGLALMALYFLVDVIKQVVNFKRDGADHA